MNWNLLGSSIASFLPMPEIAGFLRLFTGSITEGNNVYFAVAKKNVYVS